MTDRVWIADVFVAGSWPNFLPLEGERAPEPIDPLEFRRRYARAEGALEAAHFPDAICWRPHPEDEAWPAKRFGQFRWSSEAQGPAGVRLLGIPDFAHLGRNVIVSNKCRQVLSRFDLGETRFYPIRILQADGATEIDGPWFVIVFANRKRAFDAGASRNIRELGDGLWMKIRSVQDGDLAVGAEALVGPAIWIDPAFNDHVFFSDEVHNALEENGCAGVIANMKTVRVC